MTLPICGYLREGELAEVARRVKDAVFRLDDAQLGAELTTIASAPARRVAAFYQELARRELLKLAEENKRLRSQLERRKKRSAKKGAEAEPKPLGTVIPLLRR